MLAPNVKLQVYADVCALQCVDCKPYAVAHVKAGYTIHIDSRRDNCRVVAEGVSTFSKGFGLP